MPLINAAKQLLRKSHVCFSEPNSYLHAGSKVESCLLKNNKTKNHYECSAILCAKRYRMGPFFGKHTNGMGYHCTHRTIQVFLNTSDFVLKIILK